VRAIFKTIAIACGLTLAAASQAGAPPAGAPADSTGLCKDGSYYTGATKKGACKGHKGVKEWWGEEEAKPSKAEKSAKHSAAAPKAPEGGAEAAAPAKPAGAKVAAAGGGPDKVWVNTDSKVYHCPGDKWYGKTKQGEYMTEVDATAKGFRADHNKPCK
jgi:hypothetical protein